MKNNLQEQYETSQRETDEKLFKRIPSSFFNNDFWISTEPFGRRAALIDLYSLAFDSYRNGSQVIPINDSMVRIFSGQVARGLRSLAIIIFSMCGLSAIATLRSLVFVLLDILFPLCVIDRYHVLLFL